MRTHSLPALLIIGLPEKDLTFLLWKKDLTFVSGFENSLLRSGVQAALLRADLLAYAGLTLALRSISVFYEACNCIRLDLLEHQSLRCASSMNRVSGRRSTRSGGPRVRPT
jgi:hypothetical protein